MTTATDVCWDPYETSQSLDPYPTYRRLREKAPLCYDDKRDFSAASRWSDVEDALTDTGTFISGRGGILEVIEADITTPPGTLIVEDDPTHQIHRSLLVRVFTPAGSLSSSPRFAPSPPSTSTRGSARAASTSSATTSRGGATTRPTTS